MLNDEDAINDVNPFVQRDFSLPGGVRQTGNFEDFQEVGVSHPLVKVFFVQLDYVRLRSSHAVSTGMCNPAVILIMDLDVVERGNQRGNP